MRFLQIQRMTNCFQPQRQNYKLRQHINVLFRLLSVCHNMKQNCLTVISGCNNLPIPKLCPHPYYFTGGGQMWLLFLYSASLSQRVSVCFALLDALMLYSVAYLQTGMLMIAALQRCFPPSLSPGLRLCTEGNKDTRRISVVCLTKWLPESETAVPMGSTTTLLGCAQLCRGPPLPGLPWGRRSHGELCGCVIDSEWVNSCWR